MAIVTPFQEKKKQRYLILILILAALGIAFIVWYRFLPRQAATMHVLPEKPEKININFDFLKNPLLTKLTPFEGIRPLNPEDSGRSNPFQPY